MKRKYNLVGVDGNAFSLMAYTQNAMKQCKFPKTEIDDVLNRATKSDYNHLICVLDEAIQRCNATLVN